MSSSSTSTACLLDGGCWLTPDLPSPQHLITLSCCRLPVTSAAAGLPQTFSRRSNSSFCPAAAYLSPRRLLACPRRCLAAGACPSWLVSSCFVEFTVGILDCTGNSQVVFDLVKMAFKEIGCAIREKWNFHRCKNHYWHTTTFGAFL